jgi:hypothetical protein
VSCESPEEELKEFLAAQPHKLQKLLQLDDPLSQDELRDYWWLILLSDWKFWQKYEGIVRRIPLKWRAYRERRKNVALMTFVPRGKAGRPQTPVKELAEILKLKKQGLNEGQIAGRLKLTKDAVRKRLDTAIKRLKS